MGKLSLQDQIDRGMLNLTDAAILLGISYPTILSYVKRGYIQAIPFGKHKKVSVDEINRFIKEGNRGYRHGSQAEGKALDEEANKDREDS